jgi:hypothetical protein
MLFQNKAILQDYADLLRTTAVRLQEYVDTLPITKEEFYEDEHGHVRRQKEIGEVMLRYMKKAKELSLEHARLVHTLQALERNVRIKED